MKGSCTIAVLALFLVTGLCWAAPSQNSKDNGKLLDVNAIGNRNVGCGRGVGNWYSLEKQIAMGKQFATQVEQSSKLVRDPVVNEYVNRLAQNLVRNSDSQVPFTVKVIDSDEINAFALPGGFFFVNSGLVLNADDEAELAGVMAHEIAHVAACHVARQQTRGQLVNLASIPLILVGGGIGYAVGNAAGLALPMTFLKFSRAFESQADFLGTEYAYKAGYDPDGMIDMFEKIDALRKTKPGILDKTFSDHPATPDRIKKVQQEIAGVLPPRGQYIVDTSEFEDVKARLAALENRHALQNPAEHRPTLRRSTANDSHSQGDKNDGPPVLKRRDHND